MPHPSFTSICDGTTSPGSLTSAEICDLWGCLSVPEQALFSLLKSTSAGSVTTTNITADGGYEVTWPGGNGQVSAQGTFGGGTLSLEFSLDDGTTWTLLKKVETATDPDPTLTENGSFVFWSLPTSAPGYRLRLTLAGATTPNINVYI